MRNENEISKKKLLLIICQVLLDKTSAEGKKDDMSSISGGPQKFTKNAALTCTMSEKERKPQSSEAILPGEIFSIHSIFTIIINL